CWTNLSYYPIIDSISNITPSNVPVKLSNRWSSSETQMLIKEVGKQQQVKILKNKEAHAEEEKMNMEKLCTFFKELTETITKIINDQYFSTSEMQQKQHNEQ
ncbi:8613_t:CDS:2, partial [Gigaspora rosea]